MIGTSKPSGMVDSRRHWASSRAWMYAGAAVFVGLTITVLILASTEYGEAELESGAVENGAKVVINSGASGGKAVAFEAAPAVTAQAPTPPPPSATFPNGASTGYANAPNYPGSLHTCATPIQSNSTYDYCNFPGLSVGSQSDPVSNVTFYGCWFHGTNDTGALVILYGNNITFDYSSFTPNAGAPPVAYNQSYEYGIEADGGYYSSVQKLTVTNSNFWGFQDAIDTNGSTQAEPQLFEGNYIHDSAAAGGVAHVDGIGTLSGSGNSSYDVIVHNTIESNANTNAIAFQGGTYSHFTITDNQLGGFGYTVAILGTVSYITFTGNTFSTLDPIGWGPLYPNTFWTTTGSIWSNNKWYVPPGAAWGNPAQSGWYWVPSNTENSGSSDDPYVSETDY